MATSRLLRISTVALPNKIQLSNNYIHALSRPTTLMCLNKVGLRAATRGGGDMKPAAGRIPAACVVDSERETEKGVDLGLVLAYVADVFSHWRKFIIKPRPFRIFNFQMFVEKAIVDCRFFTLLAISESLLGSILCFVEGCFLVVVSYVQYLHPLSKMSEQGHVVLQIIEAIDMFLMGTAMLVFATALHVMFVGPRPHHSNPTNINLKRVYNVPSWMQVESAVEAKSKMGHALIMILQIQVLDKSKSIAVSNAFDLAYFAAAIFLSSASIFILSRTNSKAPAQAKP